MSIDGDPAVKPDQTKVRSEPNNMKLKSNIYVKNLDLYTKACLRYVNCWLIVHAGADVPAEIIALLTGAEQVLNKTINALLNLKFEFNYLWGKVHKQRFIFEITQIQNNYINKYVHEKNKRYKRLHERLPFRDLARNKYLLEIPLFSKLLTEKLIPSLNKAREYFQIAYQILRGECLFFENNVEVERVFEEVAEVCLYLREYRPRIGFKYVDAEDVVKRMEEKVFESNQNEYAAYIENLTNHEQLTTLNMELEAHTLMHYAIKACECKNWVLERFPELGTQQLIVDNAQIKIPPEVVADILESDYMFKKVTSTSLLIDFDELFGPSNITRCSLTTRRRRGASTRLISSIT